MKKSIFIFALLLIANSSFAQEVDSARLHRDAVSAFSAGDFEKALSLVDKIIAAYPNDVQTHMDKAYTLILLNRQEEAQKTVFKAVDILPNTADKISTLQSMMDIVLNNAWAENAKYAKPYLDKLLALAPKDCMTNISKVQYYIAIGHYAEAVKAMENLNTVCKGDQNINIDGNIEYILALYKSGQEEKALTLSNALFEAVGVSGFDSSYLLPNECYPLILMQADILYRQGKYRDALSALENTIENQEPDANLLLLKGVLKHLLDRKDVAGPIGKELVQLTKTTQNWEAALKDGNKQGITIKQGMVLRYIIERDEIAYYFDIRFTAYSPSKISFDWIMSNEQNSIAQGNIILNEESINTAKQIEDVYNYKGSQSELKTISTALLLSKAMFSKLQKHEPLTLVINDEKISTNDSYECNFNDHTFWSYGEKDKFNYMDAIEVKDYKTQHKLVVQDDPNNPLILYYAFDIKMQLISIE